MTALEPAQSPGLLLWRATLRWQRMIAAALSPFGLTHVQFVLLASTWWLNEAGSRPSQVEIARLAGTDVKMTSEVLRALESRGLLRRESSAEDARARQVTVTAKGRKLAPRALAEVEAVDARFFADVPTGRAITLLARLADGGDVEARETGEVGVTER